MTRRETKITNLQKAVSAVRRKLKETDGDVIWANRGALIEAIKENADGLDVYRGARETALLRTAITRMVSQGILELVTPDGRYVFFGQTSRDDANEQPEDDYGPDLDELPIRLTQRGREMFHNATENFNKTPRAKRLAEAGAPYKKREIELVKFASKKVVVDNVMALNDRNLAIHKLTAEHAQLQQKLKAALMEAQAERKAGPSNAYGSNADGMEVDGQATVTMQPSGMVLDQSAALPGHAQFVAHDPANFLATPGPKPSTAPGREGMDVDGDGAHQTAQPDGSANGNPLSISPVPATAGIMHPNLNDVNDANITTPQTRRHDSSAVIDSGVALSGDGFGANGDAMRRTRSLSEPHEEQGSPTRNGSGMPGSFVGVGGNSLNGSDNYDDDDTQVGSSNNTIAPPQFSASTTAAPFSLFGISVNIDVWSRINAMIAHKRIETLEQELHDVSAEHAHCGQKIAEEQVRVSELERENGSMKEHLGFFVERGKITENMLILLNAGKQ